MSSYLGTWVLSSHDFRAAPQAMQSASPVCGTKTFSSVRLYSAPQLHCTIVAIHPNMRFGPVIFQPGTYALCQEAALAGFADCAFGRKVLIPVRAVMRQGATASKPDSGDHAQD